jgi:hypothetical protein
MANRTNADYDNDHDGGDCCRSVPFSDPRRKDGLYELLGKIMLSDRHRAAPRVNMPAAMAPHDEDSISVDTSDGRTITGAPRSRAPDAGLDGARAERRKRWPLTAGGDIDTQRAMTALAAAIAEPARRRRR